MCFRTVNIAPECTISFDGLRQLVGLPVALDGKALLAKAF